jgi:ABC-type multidrug transport system fused ATPase/permease subunit
MTVRTTAADDLAACLYDRLSGLGSVVVFATTIFALWMGVTNGSAAIVIIQAEIFAEASRQLVKYEFRLWIQPVLILSSRVAAQLELDFNSVERVIEYLDVPQEAPAIIEKSRPPAYWPSNSGSLVVDNLVVRYAPDLPPVLRNISFSIKPSEKIGVVRAVPFRIKASLPWLRSAERDLVC